MPFNGNGTFVLPGPPLEPGEIVSADEHNELRDDMAAGFTDCVTRDGQSPAVANLPMGGFKHTNVGASNALTNYARTDQVQNSSFNWLTSVSGSNTITAASAVAPAAYAAGQRFAFIPSAVNTDPVTININSLGAKSIKINGQDDLYAGFLNPGTVYTIVYDGTAFQVALANNSGVFYVERFSGDGSETEFTLTRSAINKNYLLVYIYGVYQQKDTYSFSGTTLTFDTAPPLGTDNIEVVISSTLAIGETDASAVSYTLPATGAVTTNVEAKLAQTVSVKDFGAVGDGVTDDAQAYTNAADSGATEIYVPSGTFYTSLAPEDFVNKLVGPGFTIFGGDYATHRVNEFAFVYSATPPATWSNVGNPAGAMSGELVGKAGVAEQAYISGANTAGAPTTGYAPVRTDLAQSNLNMVFDSGHNESLTNTEGRTGVGQYSSSVIHLGEGDLFNYYAQGYVNNGSPRPTTHWLADPALTVLAGGATSVTDNANIVGIELSISDGGHEVTGTGCTFTLTRSVLPSPNPKEYVWTGYAARSAGSQPLDAAFQGVGPIKFGLDFSAASIPNGGAAVAIKKGQLINFDATNTSPLGTADGTVRGGTNIYAENVGNVLSATVNGTYALQLQQSQVDSGLDGNSSLGASNKRWTTVYAITGTINTSDANEKTDVVDISEAEKRVALHIKSKMKRFKFKDAVAAKGDNARYHFGVLAQEVKAAFHVEGLNAEEYGMFCSDTWTDESGVEHTRLGVRYDELLAFIIGAM